MHNPEQSPHQLLNSAPMQNAFEAARYLFARELSDYRRYHYASTLRFLRFLEHFGRSVSALQALQSPPADLVTGLLPHAEVINEAARERLVCWQIVEGESCWYVEPESFAAFDWKIPGERAGLPEQWPYDYAQQPFHWQKKGIMCRDGFKEPHFYNPFTRDWEYDPMLDGEEEMGRMLAWEGPSPDQEERDVRRYAFLGDGSPGERSDYSEDDWESERDWIRLGITGRDGE